MKVQKTRIADIHKPNCERRLVDKSTFRHGDGRHGNVTFWIKCPFCQCKVECHSWSIAGGGKRCYCGAMMTSTGEVYKLMPVTDDG